MKVSLEHLHCTLATWIHRQILEGHLQYLLGEVIMPHESRARVPFFAMYVKLDRETKKYIPLSKKPDPKQAMLETDF